MTILQAKSIIIGILNDSSIIKLSTSTLGKRKNYNSLFISFLKPYMPIWLEVATLIFKKLIWIILEAWRNVLKYNFIMEMLCSMFWTIRFCLEISIIDYEHTVDTCDF